MLKKLLIILLGSLVLTGCASATDEQGIAQQEYYSFVDSNQQKVVLNSKPNKVAVLFSSYAQCFDLAGEQVDITVQESVDRGFADEDAIIVDDGSGHTTIDKEALIAAKPDLVIGTTDYAIQQETVDFCKEQGIPSAAFKVETIDDYLAMLKIFTDISGNAEAYEEYGVKIKDNIVKMLEDVQDSFADIDALLIRSGSSARSAKAKCANDHFAGIMLEELQVHNIADDAPILLDGLSLETIVANDPDIIFITTMGNEEAAKDYMDSLLQSDGWKDLSAVKKDNVYYLPKELFHFKPNDRWDEAYAYLIDCLKQVK